MENGITRNWPLFFVAVAMGFSFYALSKVFKTPSTPLVSADLSYEMPRPSEDGTPYDLSGRTVNKTVQSDSNNPVALAPYTNQVPNTIRPDMQAREAAYAKSRLSERKKFEDKRRAAALAAKAKKEKAKVAVRLIESSPSQKSNFQNSDNGYQSRNDSGLQAAAYNPPASADSSPNDPANEKPKLSAGQWRSLLFAQPSAKNGTDFLGAFRSGDVEAASFYQVTEELLVDTAVDRQKLALFLLKQNDSEKTFSLLVTHDQEKNQEPMKTQIKTMIRSYGEASRFQFLAKALYSSDVNVVRRAAEVMSQTVAAQKVMATSSRDSRSPGSAPVTVAQLQSALPALSRLLKSNDPAIVQQAQTLIDSIQALKPIQRA